MSLSFLKNLPPQKKISSKTLLLFTTQLATLLQAGMPLLPTLVMLKKQQSQKHFKKIIADLIASLYEGKTFSSALSEYPIIFSHDYRSMVIAGEQGGILGEALHQLVILHEKRQRLHEKLFSILLYPSIVLIASLLILGVLFFFVVPKFEAIFSELFSDKTLPALTQAILNFSRTVMLHPRLLLIGSILLLGGISLFFKTDLGLLWRDRSLLKMPYFKTLFQKHILARFTRTVGTLLTHGVPLLQALELGKENTGSRSVDALFQNVHDSIQSGNSIAASLRQHPFFPLIVINMMEVGEATGQLPRMLLNLADLYEEEIEIAMKRFLAILEPTIILVLAFLIGTIIVALFLPLVTMMGEIGS